MTNVASREEMSESVWPVYDSGWFEDMDNNSSPTDMEPPTTPTPLLEAPEPAGGGSEPAAAAPAEEATAPRVDQAEVPLATHAAEASAEDTAPAGGGSEPAAAAPAEEAAAPTVDQAEVPAATPAADASMEAVSLSPTPSPDSPMPSIAEDEQVGSPGQGCPRFDRFDFVMNYGLRSIDSYD